MAKTQVTTKTQAPVAPVVADKTATKMERAKPIFEAVMKLGEDKLAGKTHRAIFIERAIAELDMKAAGANTYFQNLKNEANGEGRYKYSPGSKAEAAPTPIAQTGDPVLDAIHELGTKVTALNRRVTALTKAQAAHA